MSVVLPGDRRGDGMVCVRCCYGYQKKGSTETYGARYGMGVALACVRNEKPFGSHDQELFCTFIFLLR